VARTPENEFTYSKRDKAVADLFLDDAEEMCRVAYAIRAQRLDSRSSRWCSHDSQRSPLHQPAGPGCLGMYLAVAVGPLGWHGDRRNSPCFAGLDTLFWVDRLDGGGVVFQVVPRT
jgi:hypothetical protein